jgi:hypothetical protein
MTSATPSLHLFVLRVASELVDLGPGYHGGDLKTS